MRRGFDVVGPNAVSGTAAYHLMNSLVVPRPIAWISSRSAAGVDNLAPHSFFNVACREPAIVQFVSVGHHDTLKNVLETGEFVINSSPLDQFEKINACSTDFPHDMSEFDEVGLTREPSTAVAPPRVAESPAAIECRLNRVIELGDSWLVLGDVVHVSINEDVLEINGDRVHPAYERLAPLARLGRDEWGEPGPTRRIKRIPYASPDEHR